MTAKEDILSRLAICKVRMGENKYRFSYELAIIDKLLRMVIRDGRIPKGLDSLLTTYARYALYYSGKK